MHFDYFADGFTAPVGWLWRAHRALDRLGDRLAGWLVSDPPRRGAAGFITGLIAVFLVVGSLVVLSVWAGLRW